MLTAKEREGAFRKGTFKIIVEWEDETTPD